MWRNSIYVVNSFKLFLYCIAAVDFSGTPGCRDGGLASDREHAAVDGRQGDRLAAPRRRPTSCCDLNKLSDSDIRVSCTLELHAAARRSEGCILSAI
jgi:hypothetical protein